MSGTREVIDAHGHHRTLQPDIEDQPLTHYQALTQAVTELLIEKAVFSPEELRHMLEVLDSKNPGMGARLVVRSWLDPEFEARALADVGAAAEELDIDPGVIPIRAVKNTPEVHNVLVCTLCSCYPRMLLGVPPDWYKSRAYRSRVVREPRQVLAEFGTTIPDSVELRVHDSTAELRYMVIPMRPAGTEGMDEEALQALVTRDCMIGVTLPQAPGAQRQ